MSSQTKRLIYFCGSIRGGRDDAPIYKRIIDQLKDYGEVLTEHIADPNIMEKEKGTDKFIHDRDMSMLLKSDEVTQPSLGVGYEIGRAVENKKKILCLFRPDSGKPMIHGAEGDNFSVKNYKEEDIPQILKEFFDN
ncbi:putative 2'-deoxynucleoside 5'-phosphate N-hydrolase 1 [Acropora cervicornis]|uniref:Putative 2'-deoxynucleoside 5'-phosphate N-hydrolase 1 n=1 Tax=Acropora cervicornis TaxID=6130 RepID=A0AAD9QQR9_ACRCE|nr:putative 2'-deoxynucleoside 5'-phosphate N-hydrolase 1 [Acropora cervicornis]